ncbi:hypothetical protein ABZ297_34450 [Nonomuraea sp. NPDC005983]
MRGLAISVPGLIVLTVVVTAAIIWPILIAVRPTQHPPQPPRPQP